MIKKRLFALIITVCLLFPFLNLFMASAASYSTSQIKAQIESIITYKEKTEGSQSLQSLVSDILPSQAGVSAEWYVLSLKQYNNSLDFSEYKNSLLNYVSSNEVGNAVEREKYALLLALCGYNGSYISDTISDSTGKLGIMSYVYSLHLLNLGFSSDSVKKNDVISVILSRQLSDGGWAISGKYGDVDVTAMVIQSLSQNMSNKSVKSSVERGTDFLSQRLDENCEYSSYGKINSESTSQVIIALSSLEIDLTKDTGFIKNGKNLLDTLISYRRSDSGFAHINEGSTDAYATVQALMAFVSYYRFLNSMGSIYTFNVTVKPVPETTIPSSASTTESITASSQTPNRTTSVSSTTNRLNTTTQHTVATTRRNSGGFFSLFTTKPVIETIQPLTDSSTGTTVSFSGEPIETYTSDTGSVSSSLANETSAVTAASSIDSIKDSTELPSSQITSSDEYSLTESITMINSSEYTTKDSEESEIRKSVNKYPFIAAAALLLCAVTIFYIYKKRH